MQTKLFFSLSLYDVNTYAPLLTNEGKLKDEGEQTVRADVVRIPSDHVDSARKDYAEHLLRIYANAMKSSLSEERSSRWLQQSTGLFCHRSFE